jgi:hypothetical protein
MGAIKQGGQGLKNRIQSNRLAISNGQVAQLVEQRTENPRVGGSIPPLATISNQYDRSNPTDVRSPEFLPSAHLVPKPGSPTVTQEHLPGRKSDAFVVR